MKTQYECKIKPLPKKKAKKVGYWLCGGNVERGWWVDRKYPPHCRNKGIFKTPFNDFLRFLEPGRVIPKGKIP